MSAAFFNDLKKRSLPQRFINHPPNYRWTLACHSDRIYLTSITDDGADIYQYNIQTDEWILIDCNPHIFTDLSSVVDVKNETLYIVGADKIDAVIYSLDINTKQCELIKLNAHHNVFNRKDFYHYLAYIPSPINELHLIYSSSLHHIRMDADKNTKHNKQNGLQSATVRDAKCIFIDRMNRFFASGGKEPKLKLMNADQSDIKKQIAARYLNKRESEEILIKSKKSYYFKPFTPKSIWYCDLKDNEWKLYKQRLLKSTRSYAVIKGFEYFIFFFYYTADQCIWCLDLLSGGMVKCKRSFPLKCSSKMRIVSSERDCAHFISIHDETYHVSMNLIDFVPDIIKQRHSQRYFTMIQKFVEETRITSELIRLIAMFVCELCHC